MSDRRLLLLLFLYLFPAVGVSQSSTTGLPTARELYDGGMMPDAQVRAFSQFEKMFPARVVSAAKAKKVIPVGRHSLRSLKFRAANRQYDFYDYLSLNRVAGLLVIKRGQIVEELYQLGITSATRWASFSVAKSVASTLVGAALQDGSISSLDDQLTKYLPVLSTGPYADVTVRQLLQMTTGVGWDETYTNPKSDRRRLLERQLAETPGAILEYMNSLKQAVPPGSAWNYNTGETVLIGFLLEAATRMSLAQYLSEKLWKPLGMEADATWQTESPNGGAFAGGGLAGTLRDFGRFGLFALSDGTIDERRVVPQNWFAEAGSRKLVRGKEVNYGYMWWLPPPGDPVHESAFYASGVFGQRLYLNPAHQLVIVVFSARPKPTGANAIDDREFFKAVASFLAD